ncbi:MAG: hypothetical protein IPM01_29820 [Burkholderiaceae bacterium]|nr:hypothetical protein [Burkholderiaceae bacterium]
MKSIDIYRGDAFQFDGKSDGKNLALTPSEFFTVSTFWSLTVKNSQKTKTKQQLSAVVAAKSS